MNKKRDTRLRIGRVSPRFTLFFPSKVACVEIILKPSSDNDNLGQNKRQQHPSQNKGRAHHL